MEIYCVILEDKHYDVDVKVFSDHDKAIKYAEELARYYGDDEFDAQPITKSMLNDGYVFYVTYSCEGDSVTVIKRVLDKGKVSNA
jgi:hypothetical protein